MAFLRVQIENNIYEDYDLMHGRTTIGRHLNSDIVITNPSVSNKHARINIENGCFVTDLRSSNGTFLNGKKVLHAKLKGGDIINFASISAMFFE